MASKIQIKRGNKADLPILSDGEYGFCQDTSEIFIGNGGTNIKIYPTTSLDASSVTVEDIESMFESVNVEGVLSELNDSLAAHQAEIATQNKLGHVKVDDITIFINEDGVISVNNPYPHDFSGSPGSKLLIAGTMEEGFFGEVPASELITGDALASECGISQGTSQHSTAGWLKFAYKGKILFRPKKAIRHSISWDAINSAKCVYGDSGDTTVVIGGLTYKVRLMRGGRPDNDPKVLSSAHNGAFNHESEWNRLMCQIHEQAINKNWAYPDNVESNIGILAHNLGTGTNGMYTDADLALVSVDGRVVWCQEIVNSATRRLNRGSVSNSSSYPSSSAITARGWCPVLELVD